MQKPTWKKLKTMIVTGIVDLLCLTILPEFGVPLEMCQWLVGVLTGLAISYIVGQGVADSGKEAERLRGR